MIFALFSVSWAWIYNYNLSSVVKLFPFTLDNAHGFLWLQSADSPLPNTIYSGNLRDHSPTVLVLGLTGFIGYSKVTLYVGLYIRMMYQSNSNAVILG